MVKRWTKGRGCVAIEDLKIAKFEDDVSFRSSSLRFADAADLWGEKDVGADLQVSPKYDRRAYELRRYQFPAARNCPP